jgi:hypothetical protein
MSLTLSRKKYQYHCSHCGTPGHKINKCNDASIQDLIQEAEEVCLVSFAFYWLWNPKKTLDSRECIQTWLKEIDSSELKVLVYHFKTEQDKKDCIQLLPTAFYSKWINPYDEATICNKMLLFSDEKLKKWREFLCKNFHLTPDSVRNRIWELCYPYHRFFLDMKHCDPFAPANTECPICFGNLTPENTVKTGCNHELCKQCTAQYMLSESFEKNELSCPMCRAEIKKMCTSEKETFDILSARFCKPIVIPKKIEEARPTPTPTPILVSQLVQQERATQERKKFYKKVIEALFWVFASATISSFITQVMTQVMKPGI